MAEVLNATDDSVVFGRVVFEIEGELVEDFVGLIDLGAEVREVGRG